MRLFDSLFGRRDAQSPATTALTFTLEQAGHTYQTADFSSVGLQPTTLAVDEQRVAIIGLNGSGKSTLLKLLDGSLAATTGSLTVTAGAKRLSPAVNSDNKHLQKLVGVVRREEIPNSFYTRKTVREALERWMDKHNAPQRRTQMTIANLLGHFSLANAAERPVSSLDGEQRHLLAIVAALSLSPVTVIADEPTKGLDAMGTTHVARALFDYGKQVVFATHDISLVTDSAYAIERTLVMDAQTVAFDGKPADAAAYYVELMHRRLAELSQPPNVDQA